jgi:hypothetical protein
MLTCCRCRPVADADLMPNVADADLLLMPIYTGMIKLQS